ncbi:MAG: GNAT family N-acetyltransferase [Dehalococcoidia bacterium]
MEGLTIRKALADDTEHIAAIIHGEAGQEATAIAGCEEAAIAFGMAMVRMKNGPQGWQHSIVADLDGGVAGVLQSNAGGDFTITSSLALLAVRILGVSVITALPRLRARRRVDIPHPDGAYHVAELHTHPALRNRGIGGALLDHAEREARWAGMRLMSLNTTTINPARHLYERHGFRVVETRTDPAYERITGIAGRHLMVKELT